MCVAAAMHDACRTSAVDTFCTMGSTHKQSRMTGQYNVTVSAFYPRDVRLDHSFAPTHHAYLCAARQHPLTLDWEESGDGGLDPLQIMDPPSPDRGTTKRPWWPWTCKSAADGGGLAMMLQASRLMLGYSGTHALASMHCILPMHMYFICFNAPSAGCHPPMQHWQSQCSHIVALPCCHQQATNHPCVLLPALRVLLALTPPPHHDSATACC